jgi:hypothetical protein
MHEGGGGREVNRETLLAGRQAETQRDMALAGARVAERDDALASLDIFGAGELHHQHLVQGRQGREVETSSLRGCGVGVRGGMVGDTERHRPVGIAGIGTGSRSLFARRISGCGAWICYSITLSAITSVVGGTVSPSVLAVRRLRTNSNVVGVWIGRSDGFAPLRILKTYWLTRSRAVKVPV